MDTEIDDKILDNPDFYELLIKHLFRDPETLKKAREIGMLPEDLMSSAEYGIAIYKEFADIPLQVGTGPVDMRLALIHLKGKLESGAIPQMMEDQAIKLVTWIYEGEITPNYFTDGLKRFILRRRGEKIKKEHIDDTDQLREQLNLLATNLVMDEAKAKMSIVNPFEELILPAFQALIPCGFRRVDEKLLGSAYGDYNLLTGFSGSGKTAVATNMAEFQATVCDKKVAYMAMEDTKEGMALRFYSRSYELNYSMLRKGDLNLRLQESFDLDQTPRRELLKKNLRIFSLKGMTPISCDSIYGLLLKHYEETGWFPDVIYCDQMQFMSLNSTYKKYDSVWQEQEKLSHECDELSHKNIGGNPYVLWVLQQLKGKVKIKLDKTDVQGFKGIDQPSDLNIAIGRRDERSREFRFQSLKSRHSEPFEVDYTGQLEYMRFLDVEDAPAEDATPSDKPKDKQSLMDFIKQDKKRKKKLANK